MDINYLWRKGTMPEEQEPMLTEFVVTETYIVPARTREEVQQMIEDDDFKYGMRRHEVHIEVNF